MDLRLTDIVACPRCGPPHGLVLLAERVEERRVLEGLLGCPNCGGRFPVRAGLAELRPAEATGAAVAGGDEVARAAAPAGPAPAPGTADAGAAGAAAAGEAATRLAALMGLAGAAAGGYPAALLVGPAARLAAELSGSVGEIEVVAADPAVAGWPEAPGVTRLLIAGRLPFFDRTIRGVTLSGAGAGALLEEALRVLHPLGRLVLEGVGPEAELRARVEAAGGRVLAAEGETLVAAGWR